VTAADAVLTGAAVAQRPALLRAELLRIRSRRLVRLLLVLGYGVLLVAFVVTLLSTGRPSAAELSAAQAQATQLAEQCRSDPNVPADQKDRVCSGFTAQMFLRTKTFEVGGLASGALGVGAGFAALALVIGASSGGAEWAAKTLPSLLTWEPRRVRVLLTKLTVVVGTVLAAALVAQLLWVGLGSALVSLRGSWTPRAPGFWGDLLGTQLRAVLLAGLAGAAGFAVASLVRNTGAALGLAFVYFAVVENAVRVLWHWGRQWLVMENVTALVQQRGVDVLVGERLDPATGTITGVVVHLTPA
jgi:hypothetical protein